MLRSEVEIGNLKEEIARLTKENEELKQQLNQTNNHSTIHNSTSSNIEEIKIKLFSKSELEIDSIPSYEEMARGYEEMGQINLEISEL